MLLNKEEIEKKIFAFLNTALPDIKVTKGRQEKWRDNENYCIYRLEPFGDESLPKYLLKDDGNGGYILITRFIQDVSVVVDMVGDSAFDNYNLLKDKLFDDDFYYVGLALKGYITKPTDNTSLEKEFWKERATGGFSLRFQNESEKPISTIDEVNVEYEFI